MRRIVVDPSDPETITACYSGFNIIPPYTEKHIWRTTNGGAFWSDISTGLPNVPVHGLVFDEAEPATLYANTETGIITSTNDGATWAILTYGMPEFVPVDELVIQKDTKVLMAFTHGRSVYASETALPVELSSFISSVSGNNVILNWSTFSEINNSGFDVERTNSDNEWIKTRFVKGAGNSNSGNSYSFTERNLLQGVYKFRLKQIDFTGCRILFS